MQDLFKNHGKDVDKIKQAGLDAGLMEADLDKGIKTLRSKYEDPLRAFYRENKEAIFQKIPPRFSDPFLTMDLIFKEKKLNPEELKKTTRDQYYIKAMFLIDFIANKGKNIDKIKQAGSTAGLTKKELDKLITPLKKEHNASLIYTDLTDIEPLKTEYLDKNNMFLRGRLMTLTGEKASLKSSGTLTYLLSQNLKIGYFSDHENSKSWLKSIAQAKEKDQNVFWLNLESFKDEKEVKENLQDFIETKKIDLIMEDPPFEKPEIGNQQGLRKELGLRIQLAEQFNIGWIVTRNFSKNESKELLNRVGGYGIWINMPRACLGTFKADPASQDFLKFKKPAKDAKDAKDVKVVSLLQSLVANEGPDPKNSVLMGLEVSGDQSKKIICKETSRVPKPDKLFGKAKSAEQRSKEADTKHIILSWLMEAKENKDKDKEKENTPAKIKTRIMQETKQSKSTATRIIKSLKDKELIAGGGSGTTEPYKITKAGEKFLDED